MNRFKVGDLVKLGPPDSDPGIIGIVHRVHRRNEIVGPQDDWMAIYQYTVLIDGESYQQIPQERLTLVSNA